MLAQARVTASSPPSPSPCPVDLTTAVFTPTDRAGLPEPLPKLDTVPVGIADFRPRVGLANSWAPDDLDTVGLQIVGRLLHIVDLERNHPVSQMLGLWSRVDCSAFVCDQLDDGAAEIQIDQVDGHTQTRAFDPVAGFHLEAQNIGIELYSAIELISDDFDVVDPLEHQHLQTLVVQTPLRKHQMGTREAFSLQRKRGRSNRPLLSRQLRVLPDPRLRQPVRAGPGSDA